MTYQAEDSFRFDLVDGYVVVPDRGGCFGLAASARSDECDPRPAFGTDCLRQPGVSPRDITQVRSSLNQWGVQVTVITESFHFRWAVTFLTYVYGRSPVEQRGAAVWYGRVPRDSAMSGCLMTPLTK